jgi:hypothetical protein
MSGLDFERERCIATVLAFSSPRALRNTAVPGVYKDKHFDEHASFPAFVRDS